MLHVFLCVFRYLGVGLGILALMVMLSSCGRESQSPPKPREPLTEAEQHLQLGRLRARACLSCHGPAGISRVASYPSLAGLSESYLTEQMLAFRSGERVNPMMNSIARNLSDEDIRILSRYYESLPGSASGQNSPENSL